MRHAALDSARDGDRFAATARIVLVQETQEGVQAGLLLFLPVYLNGADVSTIVGRRAAIVGFVSLIFRMDDLMDIVAGRPEREMTIEILDGSRISTGEVL